MKRKRTGIYRIAFGWLVALTVTVMVIPFLWQIITSLKSPGEMFRVPPGILPEQVHLQNYRDVFTSGVPFHLYLRNSLIISGLTTVVCLIVGSFASYVLARYKFRGQNLFLGILLAVAMFPQVAIISPLFLFFRDLGLLNTYPGLIIPYTTFALPLTIWILTSFFRELPRDLEDAALIDGCSPFQSFYRIIVPLAAPGMVTTAILVFIFAWNEFLFAFIFNTSNEMRTVTVGITMFPGLHEVPWGTIFAASTIITIPLVFLVLVLQRRIVHGLTAGSVKG
jgi:multiple sugar transport system permease protein